MCKYLFDYNKPAYEELVKCLDSNNKCLLVMGTGVGKTTTILEYLYANNYRGLVVCPNNTTKDSWKDNDDLVDVIGYSKFAKECESFDYSNYDVVVAEEAHHTGADKWGAGIRYVIENTNLKVIGITATPDRTDDINIKETIFDNNVVIGIDIVEGIKNKVLHPFSYVGAYYDLEGIKEEYKDIGEDYLIGQLNLAINNTPTVKDIILRNCPIGKKKGLIFAKDIDDMKEAIAIVRNAFPDVEYRKVNSHMSAESVKKNKEWFANCEEGFLCNINMISEGAHYPNVNMIVMLRKTVSEILFKQQIGRVVTNINKPDPDAVVFDFVNNGRLVADFKAQFKDVIEEIGEEETIKTVRDVLIENEKDDDVRVSGQHIMRDYATEITKILDKLDEIDSDDWQEWEDEILIKYYQKYGAEYCQKKIAEEKARRVKEMFEEDK